MFEYISGHAIVSRKTYETHRIHPPREIHRGDPKTLTSRIRIALRTDTRFVQPKVFVSRVRVPSLRTTDVFGFFLFTSPSLSCRSTSIRNPSTVEAHRAGTADVRTACASPEHRLSAGAPVPHVRLVTVRLDCNAEFSDRSRGCQTSDRSRRLGADSNVIRDPGCWVMICESELFFLPRSNDGTDVFHVFWPAHRFHGIKKTKMEKKPRRDL